MKKEILKLTGLTEDQFYKKYPTEAAFEAAYPNFKLGGLTEAFPQIATADNFFSYGVPVPPTYYMSGGPVYPQIQTEAQFFSPVYSNSNNAYAVGGSYMEAYPQAKVYPQGPVGGSAFYAMQDGGSPMQEPAKDQTFYTQKMNDFFDKLRQNSYKNMMGAIMNTEDQYSDDMKQLSVGQYGGRQPFNFYIPNNKVSWRNIREQKGLGLGDLTKEQLDAIKTGAANVADISYETRAAILPKNRIKSVNVKFKGQGAKEEFKGTPYLMPGQKAFDPTVPGQAATTTTAAPAQNQQMAPAPGTQGMSPYGPYLNEYLFGPDNAPATVNAQVAAQQAAAQTAAASTAPQTSSYLSPEGYSAINKFENTIGTYDPTTGQPISMEAGDQYAQTADKEKIESYINSTIGKDTWDKLPENVKTQAYSFMFNHGVVNKKDGTTNYNALKGLAQAIDNATGGGDMGDERRAYTPEQAINKIKGADLSNPDLYNNYVNVLGDQYGSVAKSNSQYQSGPGANYVPTLQRRAISIDDIMNSRGMNSKSAGTKTSQAPSNTQSMDPNVAKKKAAMKNPVINQPFIDNQSAPKQNPDTRFSGEFSDGEDNLPFRMGGPYVLPMYQGMVGPSQTGFQAPWQKTLDITNPDNYKLNAEGKSQYVDPSAPAEPADEEEFEVGVDVSRVKKFDEYFPAKVQMAADIIGKMGQNKADKKFMRMMMKPENWANSMDQFRGDYAMNQPAGADFRPDQMVPVAQYGGVMMYDMADLFFLTPQMLKKTQSRR